MKLTLHIGTEKTGTTTLQNWFASNRKRLRNQGVYYPLSLGAVNHRKLSALAIGDDRSNDRFHQEKLAESRGYKAFRSDLNTSFDKEYAENLEIKNWVISNEHLHSRLTNIEMIERVKGFVGEKFDEVEVLVHLRPQIDVAVSLASSAAKHGKEINSKWFRKRNVLDPYFNYNLLIEQWETVFGSDRITILPFNEKPCMTSFIIDKMNLNRQYLGPINRKNESIDWRTMALINAIPALRPDKNQKITPSCQVFINELSSEQRLRIDIDVARQFQSMFEESNNQLIDRIKYLKLGDLTPDWSKYNRTANLHDLDSDPVFTEQLNDLIIRYDQELVFERCNTKLAECERELAKNHLINANNFLEKARLLAKQLNHNGVKDKRLNNVEIKLKQLSIQILQNSGDT